MKVCFISFEYPPKMWGGLGVYADQLVKGLKDKGIDVLTITRGDKNRYGERIFRIVTPEVLYWQRFFFIKTAISLFRRLNKSWKFDLVHLNGAYPIARGLKLPTVCTFHATNFTQIKSSFRMLGSVKTTESISALVLRNPIGTLCDILSAQLSDKIICPSPSIAREIQRYCFVNEEKLHVVPNGISIKAFDGVKAFDPTLLEKYGLEKDNFVLYVGRLIFLKGVDYLIRAFGIARKKCKDLKLVVMGSGPCESHLKDIARDMEGVLFIGHVDSPNIKRLLYESCLTVVVPSMHETLPTVVMESMTYGKPVIATNVGGNPFMVKNGKNGFLVAPKDTEGMSQFIKILYENPDLRKKMGAYGRELAEKNFSYEKMTTETLKVYESLLSHATLRSFDCVT